MTKPTNIVQRDALKLYDQGLWIVPLDGKDAYWSAWQKTRRSRRQLAAELANRNRNIGLVLNQTEWIDVECDTPEGEANLQAMFGGEIPPTPTWRSRRGKHRRAQAMKVRRQGGRPTRAAHTGFEGAGSAWVVLRRVSHLTG